MGNLSSDKDFVSQPSSELLRAADFIVNGGIGGVPTETVYGLAGDATNADSARKIFEAKGRPFIDPRIVHVCDMEMAKKFAKFSDDAIKLAEAFWPGPLTMILPKTELIPDIITAGMSTVAIRMPSHPIMRELIRLSNKPIAAPSANPFGYVSPTKAEHVSSMLGDRIDFVLDGGDCQCGVESTIVQMTTSPKKLLRPGPISPDEIESVLCETINRTPKTNEAHPQAPGMLKSHYSPKSNLTLFDDVSQIPADFTGATIFIKRPSSPKQNEYWLSEDGNLTVAAKSLFALLRTLDKSYTKIYCQRPESKGIGLALNDRLNRASAK